MRVIDLPVAFSIASIWFQVFLSCTKLIEIPLRPKRPVRPGRTRRLSMGVVRYGSWALTDAMYVCLDIWL